MLDNFLSVAKIILKLQVTTLTLITQIDAAVVLSQGLINTQQTKIGIEIC